MQWINYHLNSSTKQYNDIVIPHFASAGGNNSNYFYTIYRILIKLRELFNIKQKVELLEEKIRKNFYYWLDLCSRKIKKNVTFDGDIIIIIESIESFKEQEAEMEEKIKNSSMPGMDKDKKIREMKNQPLNEANLKFWLPRVFPDRVRFIITADPKSDSHNYLTSLGSEVLHMSVDRSLYVSMIDSLKQRPHLCEQSHHEKCYKILEEKAEKHLIDNSLYIKTFVSAFIPYESKNIGESDDT